MASFHPSIVFGAKFSIFNFGYFILFLILMVVFILIFFKKEGEKPPKRKSQNWQIIERNGNITHVQNKDNIKPANKQHPKTVANRRERERFS